MENMNWKAVSDELMRLAEANAELASNPRKHPMIQQSAGTVGAVLKAISLALQEGMKS